MQDDGFYFQRKATFVEIFRIKPITYQNIAQLLTHPNICDDFQNQLAGVVEYTDCLSARPTLNECPGYEIKQSLKN